MRKINLFALALLFFGAVACANVEESDNDMDDAMENVEDNMEEMGDDMEDAVDEAGDDMEDAAKDVEETMEGDGTEEAA